MNPILKFACAAVVAVPVCVLLAVLSGMDPQTAIITVSLGALGMAATADQLITRGDSESCGGPVAASKTLYQGTLAFLASGYLTDVINAGANKFAGVVKKQADNSSGSAGDVNAELFTEGIFTFAGSGFTQASVGVKCYASDNFTVTTSSSSTTYIGTIVRFNSTTSVDVLIDVQTP